MCFTYLYKHKILRVQKQTPFHRSPFVYPCSLSSRRVLCQLYTNQWVQSPLAALPKPLAQFWVDLAGHVHSRRQSCSSREVMKKDSVPSKPSFTHSHRGAEAPRGHAGWCWRINSDREKCMLDRSQCDGASSS